MPTIKIDATALDFNHFIVPGQTPNWVDANVVQTLDLPAGTYSYQIASGSYCDFTFTVSADGLVGYAAEYGAFLSGAGTDTLRLDGFAVTLDARYLTGLGIIWANIPQTGWMQLRSCRLLPFSHYDVQQGSGVVCDLKFAVDAAGRFQYAPALDHAAGGPLKGDGTNRLEFLGFPLIVDARRAGGAGVMVHPIAWGVPFAYSGVVCLIMLPARYFRLQFESGIVTEDGFDLSPAGVFTLTDVPPPNLSLDTFHGLARLTVRAARKPVLPPVKRPIGADRQAERE